MSHSRYFDRLAIALSAVCIVHCLAVPVVVAALPVLAISLADDAHFHGLILWLVVPTSVAGFTIGYRVHGRSGLVVFGALAVLALTAIGIWGHSYWQDIVEASLSVTASVALAAAHWLNFRAVRQCHLHQ